MHPDEARELHLFKETEDIWTRFYFFKATVSNLEADAKQENNKKRLEAIQSFLNAIEKLLDAIDDSLMYGESL